MPQQISVAAPNEYTPLIQDGTNAVATHSQDATRVYTEELRVLTKSMFPVLWYLQLALSLLPVTQVMIFTALTSLNILS
jgi:hypothetical protein